MAKKQDKEYDGSTPLKSVVQERFVGFLLTGLPQWKAYEEAGYKGKNEAILRSNANHALTANNNIKARLKYRRAEIERETEIKAVNLQKDLVRQRLMAELRGQTGAAIRCNELLLKTIGGFQADKQPTENLIGKALDSETAKDIRKALEAVYQRKYLALPKDDIIDVEPT